MAIDFGLELVLTNLPPFHSQTQEDPDESMMVVKQSVSMMHELYVCMYALCTCYATSSKYTSNKYRVKMYNIHSLNLIPPPHVFHGEFLFLEFFVLTLKSTGDIKNRRAYHISQSSKNIEIIFIGTKA